MFVLAFDTYEDLDDFFENTIISREETCIYPPVTKDDPRIFLQLLEACSGKIYRLSFEKISLSIKDLSATLSYNRISSHEFNDRLIMLAQQNNKVGNKPNSPANTASNSYLRSSWKERRETQPSQEDLRTERLKNFLKK